MATPTEPDVEVEADGTIRLPSRSIPLPASLSEEAREALRAPRAPRRIYPPATDAAGWKALIDETNATFDPFVAWVEQSIHGRAIVETTSMGGATVHVGIPTALGDGKSGRAWLAVHGGAFIVMGGAWARVEAGLTAATWGCSAYSVDYRMPPDHPYPAAIEDIVAAYRELLETFDPRDIVVSGVSAGGNLAAAAVLKARDDGLPVPGALIVNTPEIDLTESGDTFNTLRHLDGRLSQPLPESIALYAGDNDLTHPYLSPLFADFRAGFPPTYIQSGTRDLFLSNAVRFHRALRRAEIAAELHVWDGAPHGGFFGTGAAEADEELAEQARFLDRHWGNR